MKHLKLFLTSIIVMTTVMMQAMDYPELELGHKRTTLEPWQDFYVRLNALKGIDNYLHYHTFYIGQKSGTTIYNPTSFDYSGFNYRRDDDFVGQYGLNDIVYKDDKYVVELIQITGFDNQIATLRVYKRQEPLEDYGLKFYCKWENNEGNDNYSRYLDFPVYEEQKTALRNMQLNAQDSRVYFVAPETMVIDAHFGSSMRPRTFLVNGQPQDGTSNTFATTSPSQNSGRFNVAVAKRVGKHAITHPYRVSLTEILSLHENCKQTFPTKVFATKVYAQPSNLNCATDQYARNVTLTWRMENPRVYDVNDAAYAGKWYVYRRKQDDSSWKLLKSLAIDRATDEFKYVDKDFDLEFETAYEYSVCFYPNYWLQEKGRGGTVIPDSHGPMDEFSKKTKTIIKLTSPLIGCPEVTPLDESIEIAWNHLPVPKKTFSGTEPSFTIQYLKTDGTEWTTLVTRTVSEWEKVSGVVGSTSEKYVHAEGIESSCVGYKYRIVFDRGDNVTPSTSPSTASSTRISGGTTVTSLTCSKGSAKNGCTLTWTAHQVGSTPTTFRVSRRFVTEENWSSIYTIEGLGSNYSYFDQSCEPGQYYEYKVEAYTDCNGQKMNSNYRSDIGFARSYGTISGQVLYGTGAAVDSVRVSLTPNATTENRRPFFYATHFDEGSHGIMFPLNEEGGLSENVWKSGFTIGVWVKPGSDRCTILSIRGSNTHASLVKDEDGVKLYYGDVKRDFTLAFDGVVLRNDRWTFIYMKRSGFNYIVGTVDEDGRIVSNSLYPHMPNDFISFELGNQGLINDYAGELSMDEFRIYRRALTDSEILRSYDRMLSGNEKGLAVYWPMNEGYQIGWVFDQSSTNDAPNNVHGVMRDGCSYTEDSPNQTGQMACYGVTDADGSYVINGIPFSGNGVNYTITPSKGIHEFNSTKQTRYISSNSLVYSGVNFTDVSYFPVHGTVRYAGTTIPVDSCTFEVDGTACMAEGKPIMTDADGKFTITVPIGDHYITVKRNNHVFVDEGRYPMGHGKHTFTSETYNLDFEDATLVNFTGRIVGGFRDQNKPIGFKQSKNNIGRVKMTLTPTNDNGYLNAKKTTDGTTFVYDFNNEQVAVASDTVSIESHSYRGGGSLEECKKIYIETDAATGEFSAMVPPISYKLSEQTLVANKYVTVGASRTVDLSRFNQASADTLYTETVTTDPATGVDKVTLTPKKVYDYHFKYIADYHTTPVFKVNEDMPFGEKTYTSKDDDGEYTIDNLYTKSGDRYSYKLGYPVFISANDYEFDIEAYETYKNADDAQAEEDRQPLSNCYVQIANALSSSQSIIPKKQTGKDGVVYEEGALYGENMNGVQLDSLGRATYEWCAGLPNTNAATKHAQSITMQLIVSGKQYDWVPSENSGIRWRANGTNEGPGMKGVNVGAINMGNNFVTEATDKVIMVLRDPPGAKSSTTWKKGSTVVHKKESYSGQGFHTKDILTKSLGKTVMQITPGVVVQQITTIGNKMTVDAGVDLTIVHNETEVNTETYTTNQDISTSSGKEYVGSWGDVYVGVSRNHIFGDARQVYIPRNGQKFDVRDVTGLQDSVKTTFYYSQLDILTNVIPNYKEQIKKLLKGTYDIPRSSRKTPNEITESRYYSNLPETDPNYGRSNHDKVFGNTAGVDRTGAGPSYTWVAPAGKVSQDTIQFMLNQIAGWENIIKENEKEKVMMYEDRNTSDVLTDNISFDGGAKVTRSYTSASERVVVKNKDVDRHDILQINSGTLVNTFGVIVDTNNDHIDKSKKGTSRSNSETQTFSFTLSDNDYCDHSVDVYCKQEEVENAYKQLAVSYNGWSPVFRTRAGHTYGPYEDGDSTLFYSKGEEIMAKTIQMEVPQLIIDEPIQSTVPNGSSAFFKIKCSNQSYANSDHYFKLGFKPESNKDGAQLFVDGMPLSNGLRLHVAPNKTIEKTIEVRQGNTSILDYNGINIYLRSTTQDDATSHWGVIESVVPISAHFVPVSSDVALHINNNVVNTATGTLVEFQVSGFDQNHEGLKALRLQYRYNSNPDWVLLKEWVTSKTPLPGQENLAEAAKADGGMIKVPLDMKQYSDGNYSFRVLSATAQGNSEEVTTTSELIKVIKDTKRPSLISLPSPTNGILDLGSIIRAEFNEDISSDKITQDNNIEVYGTLIENSKNVYHVGLVGQNISDSQIATQNKIDLRNHSFTAEFWAKKADGYMLTFGSNETMMGVGVNGKTPFVVIANGDAEDENGKKAEPFEVSANNPLTFKDDEWVFWQLSYKARDPQAENGENLLSLTACYSDQTKKVLTGVAVPDIKSNGKMVLGAISNCQFADLALWDYVRSDVHLPLGMKRKSGLEDGLWHYWKMEEGHGLKAEDVVGGNHIEVPDNSWFIDNVNYSAHLTADKHLAIPMGDCNMDDSDSYALEFWYKRDTQLSGKTDQRLMSTSNNGIILNTNADGHLALTTKLMGEEKTYESVGTFGDEWHHVLLNVQRGISAMVYVDGTNQMALQEKLTPNLACDSLFFGNGLVGDIDEVRIWQGLYSNQVLLGERYNMIDTASVKGLVRYYPFEFSALDGGNQLSTTFSPHNAIEKGGVSTHDLRGNLVKANTTPSLKVAPTRSNLYYTFAASDRQVTINIDDDVLNKLEGTTVNISLKNVPDVNGNSSNRISWNAYVRKNPLRWVDLKKIDLTTEEGAEKTFRKDIVNQSSGNVSWTLNMPSWLSASPSSGTIDPQGTVSIEFTVSANVPVGKQSESIVLMNVGSNMTERCAIDLYVSGNTPLWAVDTSDKEYSIPMTARLAVNSAYSEDESDIVAAFIEDVCVGVSNVQYNSLRNSYYVNMIIYGGQNQLGKSIKFKAWDANRNVTYSPLIRKKGGKMTFAANASPFGSFDDPEVLTAGSTVEQTLSLKEGWNWVSFYVNTSGQSLNDALQFANGKIRTVKTQMHGAEWNPNKDEDGVPYGFMGRDLENLNENSMYALRVLEPVTVTVSGKLLTGAEAKKNIIKGWTWIRNPFYKNQSVTSAFSAFSPNDADVLQTRDAYTQWSQAYHRWEGLMTNFMPGVGYKYYSGDSSTKPVFEDVTLQNVLKARMLTQTGEQSAGTNYGYADNMLVIAKLMLSDAVNVDMDNVAITATNDNKETFTTLPDRGYYVLTVAGADDATFTFDATVNGQHRTLYALFKDDNDQLQYCTIAFEPDAVMGTFSSPIILTDDKNIQGIREMSIVPDGDYEVYSVQGYLIFRGKNNAGMHIEQQKTLSPGVYIINGSKVLIK